MRRFPTVAGYFYESNPKALISRIEWCFKHRLGPGTLPKISSTRVKRSIGFIVPHAGYIYSGPIAAHSYAKLAEEGKPQTFIIVGPNHTGVGTAIAVMDKGIWETPLGEAEIDHEFVREIMRNSSYIDADSSAHMYEHSIEVQLPFLHYLFGPKISFIPITMMLQTPETAKDIAEAVMIASQKLNRDYVFIASTDWTHYEPYETALRKDMTALEKVKHIDHNGLYKVIREMSISACGYGAVMALLYIAKSLGVKSADILKYATSGDITGDKAAVVGYAAVRIPLEG